MQELNTVSLSDFVKLAGVIFEKHKENLGQEARQSGLFVEEAIPQNTGNLRDYNEADRNEYAKKKDQGDQAKRGKATVGYNKTMSAYRVAEDIGITYEMRTQNKYPDVISHLTSLADKAVNRMELDLSHRIGFGTATTYTDMDGDVVDISVGDALALFSTAHLLKQSATTYRNRLANNPQISRGAIEGMEKLIVEETLNQYGEKKVMTFDVLWTTDDPNSCNTAREYLQSTASVDPGANSGVINVYKGKYRHIVLPRVATDANGAVDSTKRKYWGLASSTHSTAHLGIWEPARLKIPADMNNGEEFSTDDWNFGVRTGYGICIVNGVWIKFSSGDGTA